MKKHISVCCLAIVFFLFPVSIPFFTAVNDKIIKFLFTAARKNIPRKYSMMISTDCVYRMDCLSKKYSSIIMTVMLVFTLSIQHDGCPTFKIRDKSLFGIFPAAKWNQLDPILSSFYRISKCNLGIVLYPQYLN